jgi:type I restriction enzyme S subunit|tara:strand:+ start:185 stop:1021 length:837 start_codon:yes stop_codon:yes gene_type:complete
LSQLRLSRASVANYSICKAAKIDTLLDKHQQLIELLKEKRQTVICHAVTKGLDANVGMRDSGVEWLGEVPAQWGVSSLGHYAIVSSGATPDRSKAEYWHGDIPWIKTGEVKYTEITYAEEYITAEAAANSAVTLSPPGTLLMAMYGQGITRGRVALLGIAATYNQACAAIRVNEKISNEYLRYFFMAAYHAIRDGGNVTSQTNFNADIVRKLKITVPDLFQQQKIVEFLDLELRRFDALIKKAAAAIELLTERRTVLITAAVAGTSNVGYRHASSMQD